jgi:methyltransferase
MIINHSLLYIIPLVAVARAAEIALGEINARKMLADGGQEFAKWQRIPIFIAYALWLAALVWRTPEPLAPHGFMLGLFFLLQVTRWWAIVHLGKFWTTRIVVVPGAGKITSGPYRFVSHPIYGVLIFEVLILSLAFHQLSLGCLFAGITAGWVFLRMRTETRALKMML